MFGPSRITVGGEVVVEGVGLFTGAPARVVLRRGAAESGIVFRRDGPAIAGRVCNVLPEARRTVLGCGGATVQTVEHLMSALRGLGVTDVEIEVDGPELPIGDGSAGLWVEAIMRSAGGPPVRCLDGSPQVAPVVLTEPIRATDGTGGVVEALPLSPSELAAAMSGGEPAAWYSYHLDYANFPIAPLVAAACRRVPAQSAGIALPLNATEASRAEYAREIAPARTFCLVEEADAMRRAGLFGHVSPRDLLVIGDDGPIENTFRWPNEPARHKLLDLIGDIGLCGRAVVGRIVATRSGHALNHQMARMLMEG